MCGGHAIQSPNFCFIDQVLRLQDDMNLSSLNRSDGLTPVIVFCSSPLMNYPTHKPSRHTHRPVPREEMSPQITVSNAESCHSDFCNQDLREWLRFGEHLYLLESFSIKKVITSVTSFGWLIHRYIYLLPPDPQNNFHMRKQTLCFWYDNW